MQFSEESAGEAEGAVMEELIQWLKYNESLSGWAQFAGAMLALIVTYFTAFAPHWRRQRQLERTAERLLLNGYECLESYHRTSAHFLPHPMSVRAAGITMTNVANEIDRFPIFELPNQGSRSKARTLVAVSGMLRTLNLALETKASELDTREGTADDQADLRDLIGGQIKLLEDMITGKELKRPNPEDFQL